MKWLFKALIRAYQLVISPMLGPSCRYYPSCSQYTLEAIDRFGAIKGSYLGLRRVLRCHPFCKGGEDPVPDYFSIKAEKCSLKSRKIDSKGKPPQ